MPLRTSLLSLLVNCEMLSPNRLDFAANSLYVPDQTEGISMDAGEVYLRAMMSLVARQTFPPERLAEIVSPVANSKTYETFNLCDGSRNQAQIATALGLGTGNLSTTIKRWMEEGVIIKVVADDGKERPVHVYPVPERFIKNAGTRGERDA